MGWLETVYNGPVAKLMQTMVLSVSEARGQGAQNIYAEHNDPCVLLIQVVPIPISQEENLYVKNNKHY